MEDKLVLITGANYGIGKETTLRIAKLKAQIVMVCRNEKKGIKALQEVQQLSSNNNITLMLCDFSSLESINDFVKKFKSKYKKLDVLLNNHGAVFPTKNLSKDGYESSFAVNHLGYFSLTLQLLDLIKSSEYSRIINVASSSNYFVKKLKLDDYNWENRRYKFMLAYAESKLYNIMFTFYLAKLLKDTNVTVNCLHPGYIKTNLGINNPLLKPLNPPAHNGATDEPRARK